jgi:hypothetical protein
VVIVANSEPEILFVLRRPEKFIPFLGSHDVILIKAFDFAVYLRLNSYHLAEWCSMGALNVHGWIQK